MEHISPLDRQLIDACREYPPDLPKIKALLERGADINGVWSDESVISEILYGYPQLRDPQCDSAADCIADSCGGCENGKSGRDGAYLPLLVRFLLENGLDVAGADGRVGAFALEGLKLSSCGRYVLDACRELLLAGADPSLCPYADDDESVLTSIGSEGCFSDTEGEPKRAAVYNTMYRMMDAKAKGKEFAQIEYYDACLGRRIDHITLCAEGAPMRGIFPVLRPGFWHRHCFTHTIVLDCQGKLLCIAPLGDAYVDPYVPRHAQQTMDIAPYFKDCVGQTILSIDLDSHRHIPSGKAMASSAYTSDIQPIILIRLSNGKTLRFSTAPGRTLEEHPVAWFHVDGG